MKKLFFVFCLFFMAVSLFAIDFWYYDTEKNHMRIYQLNTVFNQFNVLDIDTNISNIDLSVTSVTRSGNVYTATLQNGVIHRFSLTNTGLYEYVQISANGETTNRGLVFELKSNAMPGLTQAIFSYLFQNSK
jgi:hypothetical protein